MFPDVPQLSPSTNPNRGRRLVPGWPAGPPAGQSRAISGTECSVHWALSAESGLLSTSVLLHLQTTIGHGRSSEGAAALPQGHSGKSGSPKQMGLFTGTWTLKATGPDESVPLRSSRLHFVGLNIARDLSGLGADPRKEHPGKVQLPRQNFDSSVT